MMPRGQAQWFRVAPFFEIRAACLTACVDDWDLKPAPDHMRHRNLVASASEGC
jgi:hypothetical protein